MLKLYLGNVEYLVGVDISAEKILKASKLSLYDELHVTDIRNFEPETKFDTVIALEVLHGLPADVLLSISNLCKQNGSVIIALPSLPNGVDVKDLINQGYEVYRYPVARLFVGGFEKIHSILGWRICVTKGNQGPP